MNNDKFLSRSNIYPALWAIIVGILGFVGALIWKSWTGPEEVIVLNNRDNSKDTTVTIITFIPDNDYFDQVNKLTSKTIQKQFVNSKSPEMKMTVDSLSNSIAKEYQLKFDSLLLATKLSTQQNVNDKLISLPSKDESLNMAQIKRPKYKMPSIVSGYSQGIINPFASISINNTKFNQKEKISLSIDFYNKSTLEKITPIYVDIVEPKSSNSVYQIWSEQYEILNTNNTITFSADFKPGNYELSIGFYLIDDLNTKFPTFYRKKYKIEII
jgi:hypothetical protein